MFTVFVRFPRGVVPELPHDARPVGAQPRWANQDWAVDYLYREQADLAVINFNVQPGVHARIAEELHGTC